MDLQNLKHARDAKHLTQAQVAKILGITSTAYQNYEYGKREPSNELLCKIADIFNVTTDYLLGRETNVTEPLEQLASEFNMTELEKKILIKYLSLPRGVKDEIMKIYYNSVKEVQEEK